MTAFTREQIEVLQATFEHVWGRMSRLQEELNEGSTRLVALLQMLVEQGVLSAEQFEAAVDERLFLERLAVLLGSDTARLIDVTPRH
jgi:hypothetical protein